MSNYTKATNFATKDSLASGNPSKVIKGTEIDTEFNAIAAAIATKQDALPTGVITMWAGATNAIPSGWNLCDGTNGTPDLRNKFIVGAGSSYGVGATGGSADAVIPAHTHTATSTVTDPGHNHTTTVNVYGTSGNDNIRPGWNARNTGDFGGQGATSNTKTTGITVATTLDTVGVDVTNKNLPPYYSLAYIMKL